MTAAPVRRMPVDLLPDLQLALRPGIVEFGWGHPDLAHLPTARLAQAANLALERAGPAVLGYGAPQGPGRLLVQLRAWLERQEGEAPAASQLLVTAGVSQALDMLCTLLSQPGDTILVQAPSYHLALRIFADHRLQPEPVPAGEQGIDPTELAAVLRRLSVAGRRPRLMYASPAFTNPSGAVLAAGRRAELLQLLRRHEVLLLEDDVYHDLWYDEPPPPSLFSQARSGTVVRLGSFSKILAPGLRLGWLAASEEIVNRCTDSGMLDSGGGVAHFSAQVVAAFLAEGWLDEHVPALRALYRAKRDALSSALAAALPSSCRWSLPGGGFFVWLRLPPGEDAAGLLPRAEAGGVSYVPGSRFCPVGGDGACAQYCRLAFSLLPPADLAEGARRLGKILA